MPALALYFSLWHCLGPRWLWFRARYAWRLRSGALRRATPRRQWTDMPAPPVRLADRGWGGPRGVSSIGEAVMAEAEGVLVGRFRLFSHHEVDAGVTPDWWLNQLTRSSAGKPGHWSRSGDSTGADLKGIWELNRFSWAFALARAHARSGDPRYADAFWRLWRDWMQRNPPNEGPNWMCGQEATFRLMAVLFAAEALGVPAAEEAALARFIVATGRRIAVNLDYALSQKNNHGVSECVGLITAALALPAHGESEEWIERGTRHLRAQLDELIYSDGAFSQHSLVYQRVLLHDLAWCASRWRGAGRPVPDWLSHAAERALSFLMAIVDPRTGGAPLFGSNDGANVLPLADGAFLDFRSVAQLCAGMFRGELPLAPGPWDEAVAWLVGPPEFLRRTAWPQAPALHHAAVGGCILLRHGGGRLFLRCPTRFVHRPSQADMLHVDIWQDGEEVACDGGSFSYNSGERFARLAEAAQHNVLTVGGMEPMRKLSRFLYVPWPRGTVTVSPDGWAEARHDGYSGIGVDWSRRVAPRPEGGFVVRDRVTGHGGRRLRWHWRLAGDTWRRVDAGLVREGAGKGFRVHWSCADRLDVRLLRADMGSAYGWQSHHYGAVRPMTSLVLETVAEGDTELVFIFEPAE